MGGRSRKATVPAAPVPVEIPTLTPCPVCRVELEAGQGPHGLARHGCRRRDAIAELLEHDEITAEDAQQALLRVLLERVQLGKGGPSDIAEIIERLAPAAAPAAAASGGKSGPSEAMLSWLKNGPVPQ